MRKHKLTPVNCLHKGQDKSTHCQAQKKRVFEALYRQHKTILMVFVETGILRANICRYVAQWEKQNCIRIVRKGICPISKHRAGFYTVKPELYQAIVKPSYTVRP
tara:strand:- start:1637 stop:1951 length:315 start_codon:yes stop_codon:yes gene_type:complete